MPFIAKIESLKALRGLRNTEAMASYGLRSSGNEPGRHSQGARSATMNMNLFPLHGSGGFRC